MMMDATNLSGDARASLNPALYPHLLEVRIPDMIDVRRAIEMQGRCALVASVPSGGYIL